MCSSVAFPPEIAETEQSIHGEDHVAGKSLPDAVWLLDIPYVFCGDHEGR